MRPRCPWLLGAILAMGMMAVAGCCTVPKAFLEGEEAAYEVLVPRLVTYVKEDEGLSEELRADIIRTTLAWRFSLEKAREALDGEGKE